MVALPVGKFGSGGEGDALSFRNQGNLAISMRTCYFSGSRIAVRKAETLCLAGKELT